MSERICRAVRYFLGVAHRTRPPGARLYQPGLDAAARDAAIDDLIKSVGLEDQRQVKAGNDFTRGLSGGNKRRLSIVVALAKRPSVRFSASPDFNSNSSP